MASFARWCFLHRRAVLAVWLIALIGFFGLSWLTGSAYSNSASLPGTDSAKAQQVLTTDFPAQAGDSDQIVVQARHGTLRSPAAETAVTSMLARVARLPDVRSVTSPYDRGGQISWGGTIGLATVNLNAQAQNIPNSAVTRLISTAKSADSSLLNVQLGGAAIENITTGEHRLHQRAAGDRARAGRVVLRVPPLGVGALLPVISALVAIAAGTYITNILTHAISIASWVPEVAFLVALGVGVDYALFVVSRHRNELLAGQTPEDATVTALNTSGRAVLLAGLTVCAALLGLFALPDPTLPGVAVTVSLLVGLTMLASLTLLPAMLGFLGPKVLRRAERARLAQDGRQVEQAGAFWLRWAEGLGRRPLIPAVAALAVIGVLALPFLSMRTGSPDASTDPPSSTTYQAYHLLAKGFGPGFNGPLERGRPGQQPRRPGTLRGVRRLGPQPAGRGRDRAAAAQPQRQGRGRRGVPGHRATGSRDHHRARPAAGRRSPGGGGQHAGDPHRRHHRSQRGLLPGSERQAAPVRGHCRRTGLPAAAMVFRSLLIPLVASVMNLLSFGVALGVMTAAFQFGWGKPVLGFSQAGPIRRGSRR